MQAAPQRQFRTAAVAAFPQVVYQTVLLRPGKIERVEARVRPAVLFHDGTLVVVHHRLKAIRQYLLRLLFIHVHMHQTVGHHRLHYPFGILNEALRVSHFTQQQVGVGYLTGQVARHHATAKRLGGKNDVHALVSSLLGYFRHDMVYFVLHARPPFLKQFLAFVHQQHEPGHRAVGVSGVIVFQFGAPRLAQGTATLGHQLFKVAQDFEHHFQVALIRHQGPHVGIVAVTVQLHAPYFEIHQIELEALRRILEHGLMQQGVQEHRLSGTRLSEHEGVRVRLLVELEASPSHAVQHLADFDVEILRGVKERGFKGSLPLRFQFPVFRLYVLLRLLRHAAVHPVHQPSITGFAPQGNGALLASGNRNRLHGTEQTGIPLAQHIAYHHEINTRLISLVHQTRQRGRVSHVRHVAAQTVHHAHFIAVHDASLRPVEVRHVAACGKRVAEPTGPLPGPFRQGFCRKHEAFGESLVQTVTENRKLAGKAQVYKRHLQFAHRKRQQH